MMVAKPSWVRVHLILWSKVGPNPIYETIKGNEVISTKVLSINLKGKWNNIMLFPLYFNIYFILTHHLYILSASITLQCQPTPNFHNKNPKKGPNPPSSPLKSSIISLPHFPSWISHLSCICECLRNFVASIFIEPCKQTNK